MEETNIPDQLTYHEPEPKAQQAPQDPLYMASRIISAIFTPFMAPIVAFLILFFFSYLRILPLGYKLRVLLMVYCFTVLLPMIGIYLLHKVNGWTLHELSYREKRFIPYGLTILSYIGCLLTMYRIHLPRYMGGIIIASLLCMVICTIINIKWKISTHMASCGMIIGGSLSFSLIFQFNPTWWLCLFILLAGMLGSARIILRQHTLNEVTGGFFVGLFCGIIGILFI
jgi:membrane-associated phospholipid phosphatase